MLTTPTFTVTSGARLRQFVLDLLRAHGSHQPATARQSSALAAYLSSLWHVAQQYRDRPFAFYFIAEMLEKAFDYPPMPYEWEPELRQPYRPMSDHLAPYQTPEYYAEFSTYAYFERVIKRQIHQLQRIFRLPSLPEFERVVLDGHEVYWANLFVESFLERGTTGLEEDVELEQDATWGYLAGILQHGQYTE